MKHCQADQQQAAVQAFLRRITDLSSPNLPPPSGEVRGENRSNRSLPVVLAPWEDGQPQVEEATTALTKDFSGRGISLVLHQPFRAAGVVVGFWPQNHRHGNFDEEPSFALGQICRNAELGGGYWQLCVELNQVVRRGELPQLEPLIPWVARLIPQIAT